MPVDICYGREIRDILTELTDDGQGWKIQRSNFRNENFGVTKVVSSGIFTNSLLGKALHLKANVIITLESFFDYDIAENSEFDLIELMYKNDIFLYNLGSNWIFHSKNGRFLLSIVFNVEYVEIVSLGQNNGGVMLHYELEIPLISITQKFPNSIILNYGNRIQIVRYVYIIDGKYPLRLLMELDLSYIDTIVTFEIYPEIILLSAKFRKNLIWIDKITFLEEISRELTHQLNKRVNNHIQYLEIPNSRKINGLDGI